MPYDSGEFSPSLRPIAGHVDAATRVPSHPRMWLTYRTYVFGTVENNVEDTYVHEPSLTREEGGGGGRGGTDGPLCLPSFWKEERRLLDKFQRDSRDKIPGQGTFFIPDTPARSTCNYCFPCLEVLGTKCHYFSSTTSPM